jgi:hypothetical protein
MSMDLPLPRAVLTGGDTGALLAATCYLITCESDRDEAWRGPPAQIMRRGRW